MQEVIGFGIATFLAVGAVATVTPRQDVRHSCAMEVAASDLVVHSRLLDVVERKGDGMLTVALEPIDAVKGEATSRLNAIAQLELLNVSGDALRSLKGQEVIAFLLQSDDPETGGLYLTPRSAGASCLVVQSHEPELYAALRREVARQAVIVSQGSGSATVPQIERVRAIVGRLLIKDSQALAIEELQALDARAVPALISLIDDRRALPVEQMMLRTRGGFEAAALYSPEKVVDVIATILEGLTGESFGALHNGGSERERDRVVNGWRVYLALAHADSTG